MNHLKLAELTSGVGALVQSLHAFGMWDKHRLEAVGQAANPLWIVALYWVCWLLLAVVLAMLLFWNRA